MRSCIRIRYRGILSLRISIDACGDVCIRFRENRSRKIGRCGSGNCWVGCRVNNIRKIFRDSSGCCKKFRGDSIIGGCWNRRRVNRSIVNGTRIIVRDTIGRILRDDSCFLLLSIELQWLVY